MPYLSRHGCQLINQAKEKKIFENCIRITKTLKGVMIKKEMDEKADAHKNQLRSKYIKLIN